MFINHQVYSLFSPACRFIWGFFFPACIRLRREFCKLDLYLIRSASPRLRSSRTITRRLPETGGVLSSTSVAPAPSYSWELSVGMHRFAFLLPLVPFFLRNTRPIVLFPSSYSKNTRQIEPSQSLRSYLGFVFCFFPSKN